MAASVHAIRPVAHLPLLLGMLRQLKVASIIDDLIPPHPDNVTNLAKTSFTAVRK